MPKPSRSTPSTLDPPPGVPEASLARRWRRLRAGVPPALFLLGWALVILIVGVLVGLLLTKVASRDALGRADAGVDTWLARHRSGAMNTLTHWVTDLASTPTITILAVLMVATAATVWRRWREPMLIAVAVTGEVVVFLGITLLVDRPRPPVPHLDEAPPTSSFPSGHTAATIALYGALVILASERARSAAIRALTAALAVVIPVAVGLARMYRGMHFLTDVLAGALLGASWLYVTTRGVRLGILHAELRHGALRLTTRGHRHARRGPGNPRGVPRPTLPRHG